MALLLVENLSLLAVTLTEIAVLIVGSLSTSPNFSKYGFSEKTGDVSHKYHTQITPATYAFAIWGIIYTWDCLWIIYAWSFIFRPNTQRTISPSVYWPRTLINCLNISWIYIWGNEKIIVSSIILYILAFTYYLSNTILVTYFCKVRDQVNRVDRLLTIIFPINGMFMYATWVTIASQLNLVIAATYNSNFAADNCATLGLTLLLAVVIGYFILESTVGERYLRHVFSVYPVLIWGGVAILVAHWRGESEGFRNMAYVIVILSVTVAFFMVKIVRCIAHATKLGGDDHTAEAISAVRSAKKEE